jgi:hypothetical protein
MGPQLSRCLKVAKTVLGLSILCFLFALLQTRYGGQNLYDSNSDQLLPQWNIYLVCEFLVVAVSIAVFGRLTAVPKGPLLHSSINRNLIVWLVTIGLLLGIAARVFAIERMPPGLYQDDATNALEAWALTVWSDSVGGRGTLFLYYLGAWLHLFGFTVSALRLAAAFIGVLSLATISLLAYRLFGARVAILALFLVSICRWHLIYSRLPWEAICVPFFQSLTLCFLLYAVHTTDRRHVHILSSAAAGICFGLGFYTYMGYRSFAAVPLFFLCTLPFKAGATRKSIDICGAFAIAFFIVCLPLIILGIASPDKVMQRFEEVSIISQIETSGNWWIAVHQFFRNLLMFNVRGDYVTIRTNLPMEPHFDIVTGSGFLLGVVWAVSNIRCRHASLLLWWLLTGISAVSLTYDAPHTTRSIGVFVPSVILAAIGIDCIVRTINSAIAPRLASLCAIALVGTAGYLNCYKYFVLTPRDERAYEYFNVRAVEVSTLVRELKSSGNEVFWSEAIAYRSQPQADFFFRGEVPVRKLNIETWDESQARNLQNFRSKGVLLLGTEEEASFARKNRIGSDEWLVFCSPPAQSKIWVVPFSKEVALPERGKLERIIRQEVYSSSIRSCS